MRSDELPAWKQRLLLERSDLEDKIMKLSSFLNHSPVPLEDVEKVLLSEQLKIMKSYVKILQERIDLYFNR